MAKKITYLFGAGASYNAVPILDSLSENIRFVASNLKSRVTISPNINETFDYSLYTDIIKSFSNDLIYLADKSEEYGTIDTYAKKLELNNENEELRKMKFLVSMFFVIWQGYFHQGKIINKDGLDTYSDIDSRYKSLISNYLIKTKDSFPALDKNVNFVSWNYDNQLESAFLLFFKNSSNLSELNNQINFLPNSENIYSNNRILHLNGMSNFWINGNNQLDRVFQQDDELSVETIIRRISEVYKQHNFHKCTSLINYAWDDNSSKLKEAKRIFEATDILVIIGYSFPTFNRSVDSELLAGLKNNFDKIVYQDPNASEELLELFHLKFKNNSGNITTKSNFKILKETDQFHIPPEYFPQGEVIK